MKYYQMNLLAQDRQHDFRREAANSRLARVAAHREHRDEAHTGGRTPRSTLRLTLDFLFGRAAA